MSSGGIYIQLHIIMSQNGKFIARSLQIYFHIPHTLKLWEHYDFFWFALCVPWKPRVHYPFPDERQHKDFFSCVYLAITGIYSFCLWNRKATNCCLCRCLGGRTLSSSGWASAIEVKWNRHRPYLASINFGFGFCLVLIWSYSYAKFIAGGTV